MTVVESPDEMARVFKTSPSKGTSAADAPVSWGKPADGLRCGWVPVGGPVAVGSAPEVALRVENVGSDPVVFDLLQEISWAMGPDPRYPGNSTSPKFKVICGQNARLATAKLEYQPYSWALNKR